MKTLFALVITVALLTIIGSGYAGTVSGINIISQTHHVWGWALDSAPVSYDLTGSEPVTGNVRGTFLSSLNTASSTAGNFNVTAAHMGNGNQNYAYAESNYVFTPATASVWLQFEGRVGDWYQDNIIKFSLTDITSSALMTDYDSYKWVTTPGNYKTGYEYGFPVNSQINFAVNPLHQYQLQLYVQAFNGEGGGGISYLNTGITPEPATIALLALGGMMIRKFKSKNKR